MAYYLRVEGTDRCFPIGPGDDLLEMLHSNGEHVATACGGVAMCGTCRVIVVSGEDALVPIKAREAEHLGNGAASGARLACQAEVQKGLEKKAAREIVVRLSGIPGPS